MCWLCENPDKTFDDYTDRVEALVAAHGHVIQGISADTDCPGWAYTVGLTGRDHPELVVVGLRYTTAAAVLDAVAARCAHTPLAAGARIRLSPATVLEAVEVSIDEPRLAVAEALYGSGVRALQLTYPDPYGQWPWDRQYTGHQPLLGLPSH